MNFNINVETNKRVTSKVNVPEFSRAKYNRESVYRVLFPEGGGAPVEAVHYNYSRNMSYFSVSIIDVKMVAALVFEGELVELSREEFEAAQQKALNAFKQITQYDGGTVAGEGEDE